MGTGTLKPLGHHMNGPTLEHEPGKLDKQMQQAANSSQQTFPMPPAGQTPQMQAQMNSSAMPMGGQSAPS
jgi:hypothetical protein